MSEIQRAVVKGSLMDLVQFRNIFTAEVTEVGGDTSAILWDAYLGSVYDPIESLMSNTVVTTTRELQRLTGSNWIPFDETAFDHSGSSTSQGLPNTMAGVLVAKANGIRSFGRKFLPGIILTRISGNKIDATGLIAMASALLAYITPFVGIGGGQIVPGVYGKDLTFHPFIGGFVSSLLGSMRRRKPGVGM